MPKYDRTYAYDAAALAESHAELLEAFERHIKRMHRQARHKYELDRCRYQACIMALGDLSRTEALTEASKL